MDPSDNYYGFDLKPPTNGNIRKSRGADDYEHLSEHERAFYKKEMYAGSGVREAHEEYVYDFGQGNLVKKSIDTPDALKRLALEIITNTGDNAHNSRGFGVEPGSVDMKMDNKWIIIRSHGEPIPVVVKPQLSTPDKPFTTIDFIFGTLGVSSNYDTKKTRTTCGTNGLGSKLVNILSRVFRVTVGDPKNGVIHVSEWTHNMRVHAKSITNPPYRFNGQNWVIDGQPYTGPAFVEVAWKVDFRVFGYTDDSYNQCTVELFLRYLLDLSFTCKIPVSFNGTVFDMRKTSDYASLFNNKGTNVKNVVHYSWPDGMKPNIIGKELETIVARAANISSVPVLEVVIVDAPNNGMILSFVNGMITPSGGAHVDAVKDVVFGGIKNFFDNDKTDGGDKITATDIKKHITLIINCRVDNPMFSGQTKDILKSPKIKDIFLSEDQLKVIKRFEMVTALRDAIDDKLNKELKKTNGSKKRHVNIESAEDANWAATSRSLDAILLIGEGASAGAYIKRYIVGTRDKKNMYGSLNIRGKFLNVTSVRLSELIKNKEVNEVNQMMGLVDGTDYSTPQGYNSLRYGKIQFCVDADSDGSHIACLLINFIYRRHPTLLQSGRVGFLLTPVIRITKKGQSLHRFYNLEDFEAWSKTPESKLPSIDPPDYFKGLGSSTNEHVAEDLNFSPTVIYIFDINAIESLDIAFKKGLEDNRKDWISKWRYVKGIGKVIMDSNQSMLKYVNISDIINTKLVEYSVDTFSRALPSYRDGLKESQRKLLFYILEHWKYCKRVSKAVKVAQIAYSTASHCKYHHGENSLVDTLVKMIQDYPGANNLALFTKKGQFGSRNGDKYGIGTDCANARYTATEPCWWLKYVFKEELVAMIPKRIVEGEEAEPEWIPCDIPLHIINGVAGIATSRSTFIPSYHPIDVIDWILSYLNSQPVPSLIPWFKGFTGIVDVTMKKKSKKKDGNVDKLEDVENGQDIEDETNEENFHEVGDDYEGLTLRTEGFYQVLQERNANFQVEIEGVKQMVTEKVSDIRIFEAPIGACFFKYRKWIESLIESGKIQDRIDGQSDLDKIDITIYGWRGPVNKKTLRLVKASGLNNISLIDDDSIPETVRNINDAMKLYCDSMAQLYYRYYESKLKTLQEKVDYQIAFIRLITCIRDKIIIVENIEESIIHESLAANQIPLECYKKLTVSSLSKDGIQRNQQKLQNLLEEREALIKTSPLQPWFHSLYEFREKLSKLPEFVKLSHHITPIQVNRSQTENQPIIQNTTEASI